MRGLVGSLAVPTVILLVLVTHAFSASEPLSTDLGTISEDLPKILANSSNSEDNFTNTANSTDELSSSELPPIQPKNETNIQSNSTTLEEEETSDDNTTIVTSYNEINETSDTIYQNVTENPSIVIVTKSTNMPKNDSETVDLLDPVLREVKAVYNLSDSNVSSGFNGPYYQRVTNDSISLSQSTVSWLEAFMFYHRNAYWTVFNVLFLVVWSVVGLFSLYRLFGLPFCSSLLTRTFYLVIHLMIFTASTFSVVQLLHLCFGSHEGLPLFLTLLLTHTPVPCLASCAILIGYCIFLSSKVPVFGSYLPSFINLSVSISCLMAAGFVGDVIVGVTHSSIALIIFRGAINCFCIGNFVMFSCRYKKIFQVARLLRREFSGELKSLVIPLNTSNNDHSLQVKNKLKDMLFIWSSLILGSCVAGTVMCTCSLFLSLFFTVSYVPLWMFWVLHSLLFLSQITLIVLLTLAAALTLVHTNKQNIGSKYFVLAFPSNENRCGSFVKHGNLIYQRVSFSSMPPTCSNNEELPIIKNNQIVMELPCPEPRPRVNLRRSVTFNCGPNEHRSQYYSKNRLAPILSENCILCSNIGSCQCHCSEMNNLHGSNCLTHHRSSRCFDLDEKETPYAYCGKFPRKNYYGRCKSNSPRNLENGDVKAKVEVSLKPIKLNSIPLSEVSLPKPPPLPPPPLSIEQPLSSPLDKDCVKDIILENHQLFNPVQRKHSVRSRSSLSSPKSARHSNPASPFQNRKQVEVEVLPSPFPKSLQTFRKYEDNLNSSPPSLQEKIGGSPIKPNTKGCQVLDEKKFDEVSASPLLGSLPLVNGDDTNGLDIRQPNDKTALPDTNYLVHKPPLPTTFNSDYDSFTLPSPKRHSLKRNHSSAGDFVSGTQDQPKDPDQYSNISSTSSSKLKYPWYGTWSGRRSKKRCTLNDNSEPSNSGLNRLSGSKGSLSNLYGKIKPKRAKSMIQTEHINLEVQTPSAEEISDAVTEVEVEQEEPLPSISEDIDLASEIFKSSRLLSNFYALEEVDETEDSDKDNDPQLVHSGQGSPKFSECSAQSRSTSFTTTTSLHSNLNDVT